MARTKAPGSGKDFKPGQSGNPNGRPPNPPEIIQIKQMTKGELAVLMHKLINAPPEQLPSFKGTVLEMAMASIMQKAIQQGDFTRVNFFLERLFGKIPDALEVSSVQSMSPIEKLAAMREAVKALEEQIGEPGPARLIGPGSDKA